MNLNELYKPIGRLYEEVPSADYAGDYSAANGWYNAATEEDPVVRALRDGIAALQRQKESYEVELDQLKTGTEICEYQEKIYLAGIPRGYNCKSLLPQYGTKVNKTGARKNWTFVEYDYFQTIGTRIKVTLPNAIASLAKEIKQKQTELELQIIVKGKATDQSQETKTETLRLKGIAEKAEAEKAKAKAEAESKQKQTDAELRAKKIFLAIIASGVVLSAAGFAIFRR